MRIAVMLLVFWLASPAAAQLCMGEDETLAGRANQIDGAARALDRAIRGIETVPPSEAEYIEREKKEALAQQNKARFDLIVSHRFYSAHHVQKEYVEIARNLQAARDARRVADQVIYLSVALAGYEELHISLSQYMQDDRQRRTPILSNEAMKVIWFQLPASKQTILRALQCGVRQMREQN